MIKRPMEASWRAHITASQPTKGGCRSTALSALHFQPSLFGHSGSTMPRCHSGLVQRRRLVSSSAMHDESRTGAGRAGRSSHEQHKWHDKNSRPRHTTVVHAAAGTTTWDDSHSGSGQGATEESGLKQEGCGCGSHSNSHSSSSRHSQFGSQNGHQRNNDQHHHHGHHHYHTNLSSGGSSNPILSVLSKAGLFSLAEHLERHTAYTITSVTCFITALLLPYAAAQGLLQVATAALLSKAALAVTYALSGIPQLAETVSAAVSGKIDTHVLMSLSIVGTLYMGMAQEGALLLLLFRVSHLLEDRLTEKAAGSLQRLFDSVPDAAAVVEVEDNGAPKVSTTQQVAASSISIGQHVLVRPGEQVPLDGVIVWGTANLSLQHITGEEQPVRLSPGQDLPAGSLSTDGLLVVRVEATAEDSTPARIARLAAEAQAERPQLTRWLDGVGEVWSKAVIGATLATAAILPLLGVPFLGDRGALYRAMGVLTAGSPCALALVPLAYACAIAAITARGILIKSGAALDALAACKTIALDKTGTITTGSLNFAEGYVLHLNPAGDGSGDSSKRYNMRVMAGSQDVAKMVARASSNRDGGAAIGARTNFGKTGSSWASSSESELDSDDYASSPSPLSSREANGTSGSGTAISFDEMALKCAVALSRLSNHPVSRAMVDSAPRLDSDVAVLSFEQVPGAGVQGVCRVGDAEPVHVRFGAADWINSYLSSSSAVAGVNEMLSQHTGRPSRATALLSMSQVQPGQQQHDHPAAASSSKVQDDSSSVTTSDPDAGMSLDRAGSSSTLSSSSSDSLGSTLDSVATTSSSSSSRRPGSRSSLSRSGTPSKFLSSQDNLDGSVTYSFDFDDALDPPGAAAAAAAADQQQQQSSLVSSIKKPAATAAATHQQQTPATVEYSPLQQQEQPRNSHKVDPPPPSHQDHHHQQQQQQYDSLGQPDRLALLCFEDVIQSGVPAAVRQLQSGSWSSRLFSGSGRWLLGGPVATPQKDIVMLTGDNQHVAAAVAGAVGITNFRAGLKPEDKLAYITQAAAAAAASGKRGGSGGQGLLMAGDGINDAPALAAAQVGVAIASTPKDMVAAAADIIVLNGQGITNLPWLFQLADRTHTILQQNLALALASVAVATLPTVAGIFPLWLAVTLHEGSTLLVALNSLRLLLEVGSSSSSKRGSQGHRHDDRQHKHQ